MKTRTLLGTWVSDRRRTLEDVDARRDIKPKARRILKTMFGKLRLTYRNKTVVSHFEGQKTIERYEILGRTDNQIAIKSVQRGNLGERIYLLTFDGEDRYSISLGKFREYFKRAPTMPSSVFRTRGTLSAGQKSRRSPKSAHG